MRIVHRLAVASALMVAGCGGTSASATKPTAARPARPSPTAALVIQSVSVPSGEHGVVLAGLAGLGRFSAGCSGGSAVVAFTAGRGGQSEAIGITSGAARRSLTLDPGRRISSSRRLRGVEIWQISAISEGKVLVAVAWLSAARLPGSSECFVSIRADVAHRSR
jgi:hypothetical protein